MADMILTSECEQCPQSIIDDEDKARVTVYCRVKDKTYFCGQCITCDYKGKRKKNERDNQN